MKDKRFLAGLLVTVGWLFFSAYMFANAEHPSKLNEWGDSFAGFFAPLAIFWLVLGYLQQGEELRQSSDALRLQAEELKNSVEQQSELVKISREQLQQEIASVQEERERRAQGVRPRFVPTNGGSSSSSGLTDYSLRIQNIGAIATDVLCRFEPALVAPSDGYSVAVVETGMPFSLNLRFHPQQASTSLSLSYTDQTGARGMVILSLSPGNGILIFDGGFQAFF